MSTTRIIGNKNYGVDGNVYVGYQGELTVDPNSLAVRVHNGITPGGLPVVGVTGPTGYATRIYSGVGPPPTDLGQPGDFYIDTVTGIMYGPKQ